MKREYELLNGDVQDEVKLIDKVIQEMDNVKVKMNSAKVDNAQKAVIGTYLMNFYTGVENIIKRVSKEYYRTMPKGASWHKELLDLSYDPPMSKIPLFSRDIVNRLNPYRGFKHLFISGYGFKLEWRLMSQLIENLEHLWADIKRSISEFFDKL